MGRAKKIFTNWRVILLLIALVLSILSIYPNPWNEGVAVRGVDKNSSAELAGISNPSPTTSPMGKELVLEINNQPIKSLEDYFQITSGFDINQTVQIKTAENFYRLKVRPIIDYEELNETEIFVEEVIEEANRTVNGTIEYFNRTVNKTFERQKVLEHIIGVQDIGINVQKAPTSNLRKGLDLAGGTRVLLRPEKTLESEDMSIMIENLKERLNVFGISDVSVREASDFIGNQYIVVEIAGANEDEVKELLAKQGKFEAKVGNTTVFRGGQDVTYVCRSADCSGIDPSAGCGQMSEDAWTCRFRFSISLSPEAAQAQADATADLDIISEQGDKNGYLSEKLYLYLDDGLVDELNIAGDLRGQVATEIAISGSGVGPDKQQAVLDTMSNMKRLQTILITGSLPSKLEIVKTDNISPKLGDEFVRSSIIMFLIAIVAVSLFIFIRYRSLKIAFPMMTTMISELIILLGVAALIGWNLDLAAVAGIIIAVGTGVDDQIVIAEETVSGAKSARNWKDRIKRAFFIIMGAYFTTVVAMIPLLAAGAGLVKGFALTTIIGTSIGVFITRPAYAVIVENLLK